jgi:hypothetical protein
MGYVSFTGIAASGGAMTQAELSTADARHGRKRMLLPRAFLCLRGLAIPERVPVLLGHKPFRPVGECRAFMRGGLLHARGRVLAGAVRAIAAGGPVPLSVFVDVLSEYDLDEGEEGVVNARLVCGPARIITRSRLVEVSLVSRAADEQAFAIVTPEAPSRPSPRPRPRQHLRSTPRLSPAQLGLPRKILAVPPGGLSCPSAPARWPLAPPRRLLLT